MSWLRFRCSRFTTPKGSSFPSSSWRAWKKVCFRTCARSIRRGLGKGGGGGARGGWGGGETETSIPSRFLSEVPEALVQDLSPRKRTGQVDLYGERQEVREAARRNLYTGKTFNSVENIQQFFAERGKQTVANQVPNP